jgi:predicted HD superfamily hydrolase involved in NAD metabolism
LGEYFLVFKDVNMQMQTIEVRLQELLPPVIFDHSLQVRDYCYSLAGHYSIDADKLALAGLLHDCGKIYNSGELISRAEDFDIPITEVILDAPVDVLHGLIGASVAKELFGIDDNEILTAIKYHTFGANEMTLFTKLIFVANKVNPTVTDYTSEINEIKSTLFKDIDRAVIQTFDLMLKSHIEQGKLIYTQVVNSRNKMLLSQKQGSKI